MSAEIRWLTGSSDEEGCWAEAVAPITAN